MKHFLIFSLFLVFVVAGCKAGNNSDVNNGISSSQIIKSINKGKPVFIVDKIITDDLNFTLVDKHTVFSSSQSIAQIEVPVTFIKCIFLGKIHSNRSDDKQTITTEFGSNLTFETCDFRGEADFSNITVDGMLNFSGASFRENVFFNSITVKGRQSYFTAFTSEKQFNMQDALIKGDADFFQGKPIGKISFQGSCFDGNVRFSNMECGGIADFSLTTFRGNTSFTYTRFQEDFKLSNTQCDGICDLVSVTFVKNAIIANAVFNGKVNFSNTEFAARVDLSGTLFTKGKPATDGMKTISKAKLITTGTTYLNSETYLFE